MCIAKSEIRALRSAGQFVGNEMWLPVAHQTPEKRQKIFGDHPSHSLFLARRHEYRGLIMLLLRLRLTA
jgi:hypothetical protein